MSDNLFVVLVVTAPSGVYLPGIGTRYAGQEVKVTADRAEYLLANNPTMFERKAANPPPSHEDRKSVV